MARDFVRRWSALDARAKLVYSIITFALLIIVLLAWSNTIPHVTEITRSLSDLGIHNLPQDTNPSMRSSGIDFSAEDKSLGQFSPLVPESSPLGPSSPVVPSVSVKPNSPLESNSPSGLSSPLESNSPPELSSPLESNSSLRQILDLIIIDAAKHGYNPSGTDQDLSDFARQTATLRDLWSIYKSLDPTSDDRKEFESGIKNIQQILYPWVTASKDGQEGYKSFLDLAESFEEDEGLVISVGKDNFRWAVHQVITLRTVLNSTLPIEIFYAGEDDLPLKFRELFAEIEKDNPESGSIRTVDIHKKFPDPDNQLDMPGGWAMRPFAVLASSFKHVILADADTIFLKDPRALFDEAGYKQKGTLFYHDRIFGPPPEDSAVWVDRTLEDANAKYMDQVRDSGWFKKQTFYEMESGAVVFDKTRVLIALMMVCHLNLKRVRDSITYVKFYGDKESYWFAFALVSQPYYFVPGYSGGIGRITKKYKNRKEIANSENICTLQLLHELESTGEPLWFNNAITEYKGANDWKYIVPEGWVPHDGRWSPGGTRFPNEFCVEMPEGEHDRLLGVEGSKVYRVQGMLKTTLARELKEVELWDRHLKAKGLIDIKD